MPKVKILKSSTGIQWFMKYININELKKLRQIFNNYEKQRNR